MTRICASFGRVHLLLHVGIMTISGIARTLAIAMTLTTLPSACSSELHPTDESAGSEDQLVLVDDAAVAFGVVVVVGAYSAHIVQCSSAPQDAFLCGDVNLSQQAARLIADGLSSVSDRVKGAGPTTVAFLQWLQDELHAKKGQAFDTLRRAIAEIPNLANSPSSITTQDLEELRNRYNFMGDLKKQVGTTNGGNKCQLAHYTTTVRKTGTKASFMNRSHKRCTGCTLQPTNKTLSLVS